MTEQMKQILRLIVSNPSILPWSNEITELESSGYVYWSGSLDKWMLTGKGKAVIGEGEYEK